MIYRDSQAQAQVLQHHTEQQMLEKSVVDVPMNRGIE